MLRKGTPFAILSLQSAVQTLRDDARPVLGMKPLKINEFSGCYALGNSPRSVNVYRVKEETQTWEKWEQGDLLPHFWLPLCSMVT